MKKLNLLFLFLSFWMTGNAQVPQGINYQAVLRDNGNLLQNVPIELEFSIIQNGTTVYQETHNATTSNFAMVNVVIGQGIALQGTFSTINWALGNLSLEVKVTTPQNSQISLGTQSLVSVPFSLYAKQAESVVNDQVNDADANPLNEIQSLSINGQNLSLSNGGGSVTLPTGTNYSAGIGINLSGNVISNTAPNQPITLTGSGSTTVSGTYPDFTINSNDQVDDADANPGNEIQSLALAGNNLSISNGNTVNLSSFAPQWSVNGSNIFRNTGLVGIGTSNPTVNLEVKGAVKVENWLRGINAAGTEIYGFAELVNGGGFMGTRGANGSYNFVISATGNNNDGLLNVCDANGDGKVGMFISANGTGHVFADGANGGIKAFRMNHPLQANKQIYYCSLEGPEAAAYTRGTAQLVNGKAVISFPEHFQLVANSSTLTVSLTALSAESKGLAVIEKRADGFTVQELHQGQGNYPFDWRVEAVRKGHENFEVIRDKSHAELAPISDK